MQLCRFCLGCATFCTIITTTVPVVETTCQKLVSPTYLAGLIVVSSKPGKVVCTQNRTHYVLSISPFSDLTRPIHPIHHPPREEQSPINRPPMESKDPIRVVWPGGTAAAATVGDCSAIAVGDGRLH